MIYYYKIKIVMNNRPYEHTVTGDWLKKEPEEVGRLKVAE